MWLRKLIILLTLYIVKFGAAQSFNGSLYIPSIPSNGGLEPGEVIEAELLGTDGEASTFRLWDSLPTLVNGLPTRTTATFTLVSAPTAVLLTIDTDRKLGQNNVEEDIHVQCFIDDTGRSVCEDLIVEAVNRQRTVTITSLFSEMTSAVPVIAVGFGSNSSVPPTTTDSSNSSSIPTSTLPDNSTLTTVPITPTSTPLPVAATPTSSNDDAVTVTITPGLSPSGDPSLTSSAAGLFGKHSLLLMGFTLSAMYCFI